MQYSCFIFKSSNAKPYLTSIATRILMSVLHMNEVLVQLGLQKIEKTRFKHRNNRVFRRINYDYWE